MSSSDENINIDLITRYLSGEANKDEEQALSTWLNSDRDNQRLFEEYKSVWEKMDRVKSVAGIDVDREWRRMESRMDQSAAEDDPGKSQTGIFVIGRIAAAAVVILALALGGLYTSRNVGHRTLTTAELPEDVILPDGSTVTLNRESMLRYPKKFKKEQRTVSLEGEGFFEVQGDPEWPFVITASGLDIRVLGTSFNVNAYESNTEVEVVVKTGEVAVTKQGDVPRTIILKPGSRAVYHKADNNLKLSTRIDRNYLAWKTKTFEFRDESLEDVAAALNKVYSSDIVIPSDSLKKARITSSFHEQTLDAILNVLSATLDIEVIRSGEEILLKESN